MYNVENCGIRMIQQNAHEVDSLAPGRCGNIFTSVFLKLILWIDIFSTFYENGATELHGWYVNIGTSNGLAPSGNKPLLEPVLTKIYVATWYHQAIMS